MIILSERLALMDAGIITTTGRKIIIEDEIGSAKEVPEPEEIHTYKGWQERHRQVRRGERAIDCFMIWKHVIKKPKDAEAKKMSQKKKCFLQRHTFSKKIRTMKFDKAIEGRDPIPSFYG